MTCHVTRRKLTCKKLLTEFIKNIPLNYLEKFSAKISQCFCRDLVEVAKEG